MRAIRTIVFPADPSVTPVCVVNGRSYPMVRDGDRWVTVDPIAEDGDRHEVDLSTRGFNPPICEGDRRRWRFVGRPWPFGRRLRASFRGWPAAEGDKWS